MMLFVVLNMVDDHYPRTLFGHLFCMVHTKPRAPPFEGRVQILARTERVLYRGGVSACWYSTRSVGFKAQLVVPLSVSMVCSLV